MSEPSTEEKILQAAKTIFTQKGYAAARTQEIADLAGVNKGLLQYYFKGNSKEKLFMSIFEEAFFKFLTHVNGVIKSDLPLLEKLEQIVESYLSMLQENPNLPAFIVTELHTNTHAFVEEVMRKGQRPELLELAIQIHAEQEAGKIKADIQPIHLVLNMLSMCVFPFLARPLFQRIAGLDDASFDFMMASRKTVIVDFIRSALRP
jgi:TetR/AcrR family transcriptional regulator